MLPDLERLIHLQDIETRAGAAQRVVAAAPERIAALDATLAAARAALEASQKSRKAHEAAVQDLEAKRSKYRG